MLLASAFLIPKQKNSFLMKRSSLKLFLFIFLEKRQIGLFSNGRQESKEASRAEVLLALGLAKSFGHQRPAGRGQRRDLRLKRVSFWDCSILMLQYSNALAYRVEFNISENSPSLLLVNNLTVRVTSREWRHATRSTFTVNPK